MPVHPAVPAIRRGIAAAIAAVGKDCTITVQTGGTFNPATGSYSAAPTATTTTVKGRVRAVRWRLIDNVTVVPSDLEVKLPYLSPAPKIGDRIAWNGVARSVVKVEEKEQFGEPVSYLLVVRGIG